MTIKEKLRRLFNYRHEAPISHVRLSMIKNPEVYMKVALKEPGRVMKTIFALLVMWLLALPTTVTAANLFFWIGGQSNAVGRGDVTTLTDAQRTVPVNAEFWLYNGRGLQNIQDMKDQYSFGTEIILIHQLAKMYPDDKIILLKWAAGRTSITRWEPEGINLPVDYPPEKIGDLYDRLLTMLPQVAQGRLLQPKAVFWIHGEADSKENLLATNYYLRLQSLFDHLKADLGNPNLHIYIAECSFSKATYAYKVVMAEAEMAKNQNAYFVPTVGLSKSADAVHYDSAGILKLGRRIFEIYRTEHP